MNKFDQKFEILQQIALCTECSEEELKNLDGFINFLLDWNKRFNFIGKSTIDEVWHRHVLDSVQLLPLIYNIKELKSCSKAKEMNLRVADFGSGAGFPGVILSILGVDKIHLIEKSFRKADFLRQARVFSKNQIFVHQTKIEDLIQQKLVFDVIVSRAFAPLKKLLEYSSEFLDQGGFCLFLKGRKLQVEIDEAREVFEFEFDLFPSITATDSRIILMKKISKKTN